MSTAAIQDGHGLGLGLGFGLIGKENMIDNDSPFIPNGCFSITKSDTVADTGGRLVQPVGAAQFGFRGVWIEGDGNLKVTFLDGTTGVFGVKANTAFVGKIQRVWSTGTTATVTVGFN